LAPWRHEPIADAANGLDRGSFGTELSPDLADMDVHGSGLTGEIGTPDILEEAVTGQDDARIAGEGSEQVELARSQPEIAVRDRRLAPARVDSQGPDLHRPAAARRGLGPAKDGLDPGDER